MRVQALPKDQAQKLWDDAKARCKGLSWDEIRKRAGGRSFDVSQGFFDAWEAARVRSVDANEQEQGARMAQLGGVAAGLVSVSTTCKEGELKKFSELLAEAETVEIDKNAARITRLRKSLGVAAKCLHNLGARNQRIWMQTLTYRGDNSAWRAEHISRYLDALRKWHYSRTGSKKVRYVWCAELQPQRGVIHYHVVLWLDNALTPPKGDRPWKSTVRGAVVWHPPMWRHGMTNRLESHAPVAYIMKYASKIETKNIGGFPRGARIHGCGGLDVSGRGIRRWVMWPSYVQGNADCTERWRPAKGGGYENVATGEVLHAEFAPAGGGFTRFVRVRRHPRAIEAAGPFMWLPCHQTNVQTLH